MFILEVVGDPVPQKQTQFNRHSGHAYNPSAKAQEYIRWQIRPYAPKEPLRCPVQVDLTFFFKPPKSTSSIKRRQMLNHVIHHIKRPDVDNCAYLITNALKTIFFQDDSQIIDLNLHKRYAEEAKTVIKIVPIEEISKTTGEICES